MDFPFLTHDFELDNFTQIEFNNKMKEIPLIKDYFGRMFTLEVEKDKSGYDLFHITGTSWDTLFSFDTNWTTGLYANNIDEDVITIVLKVLQEEENGTTKMITDLPLTIRFDKDTHKLIDILYP